MSDTTDDMEAEYYAMSGHIDGQIDMKVWTQKNRTVIKIEDMDNDHLQNTINYIKRNCTQNCLGSLCKCRYLDNLYEEQKFRERVKKIARGLKWENIQKNIQ